jgi:hypothetical protein
MQHRALSAQARVAKPASPILQFISSSYSIPTGDFLTAPAQCFLKRRPRASADTCRSRGRPCTSSAALAFTKLVVDEARTQPRATSCLHLHRIWSGMTPTLGANLGEGRIVEEFENGDYIVVLDGSVLEVFYGPRASSDRRHVKHVNIDFTVGRHGEMMIIGSKVPTDERRSRITIVPDDKDRINAMVGEAIARGASNTGPLGE